MDLMTLDDGNDGLKTRTQYIKERELVEVSGLSHCDVINLNCLLLNNLPLKMEWKSESFVLMTDGASRYFRIIEAWLCVQYAKLSDVKYRNIQQSLPATLACCPVKRLVMKRYSVASEISSLNWKNVGQLPNRLVMDIVDNDVYTGSIAKNSFNFKHFNAFWLRIYLNGKILGLPHKLNFTDNQYIDRYRNVFATGRIDMDNSLNIMRVDSKSDYCIFGFDTSPTLCHGEPPEWKWNRILRTNIEFRTPLPNSISTIMYMEFDNNISVDKTGTSRKITKNGQQ